MNAPWTVAAGVFLVLASLAFPCRALAQLVVDLEVTQGIQYFEHATKASNSIDLVAGRNAAVRARVKAIPAGKMVDQVTGTLSVSSPGSTYTDTDVNHDDFKDFLYSGAAWDRADANSTLNFKVPLKKGTWDFKATVDIWFTDGTTDTGTGVATGLDVVEVRPFEIRLVPMTFTTFGGATYGPPDPELLEEAIAFLEACFPLQDGTVFPWELPQDLPTKDRGCRERIDDQGGKKSDVNEVLAALEAMRVSTVKAGGVPDDLIYYGFAEPPAGKLSNIANEKPFCILDYYGWSSCPGRVGFGTSEVHVSPKNFAHEFGHLLGLEHCEGCLDSGRSCGLDGQVGFEVATMSTKPDTSHMSFMTCALPPKHVWVTPEDYAHCLEVVQVGSTKPLCTTTDPQPDPPASWSLVVRGSVTPDGNGIEWVDPVFRYPWKVTATPAAASGPYEIIASGGGDTVIRRFNPTLRTEPINGNSGHQRGFFSVVVPFPDKPSEKPAEMVNVDKIRIRKGTTVIFTMTRTQILPVINIATPQPLPNPLNQTLTLQWTVADADSPPANLLHQLVYSHDNGQSFNPVAVNLTTGTAVFNPAPFISSGPEQGLLRILVTDGLNTVFKDITSLTVQ